MPILDSLLSSLRRKKSSVQAQPVGVPGHTADPMQATVLHTLLIVYEPGMDVAGTQLSRYMRWNNVDDLVKGYISDVLEVSGGLAHHEIIQRIDVDEFPAKIDGFRYEAHSYLDVMRGRRPPYMPQEASYNEIIERFNVLQRVAADEIDELWIFNFPHAGFYESIMAGPGALVNRYIIPPEAGFTATDVKDDNTWEYKWQTANLNIDAGTYTVYAVATPNDKSELSDTQYGTVSVIIRKPFVTAQASQSTVAQGDKSYVRGVAEGQPSDGVAIWIMGKNFATANTESVNDDGTFEYEVDGGMTSTMTSGQYFVVVQHPMYNDKFDVYVNGDYVVGPYPTANSNIFKLYGSGSLQGSDAANALTVALDNPSVDDTYTKLQFL